MRGETFRSSGIFVLIPPKKRFSSFLFVAGDPFGELADCRSEAVDGLRESAPVPVACQSSCSSDAEPEAVLVNVTRGVRGELGALIAVAVHSLITSPTNEASGVASQVANGGREIARIRPAMCRLLHGIICAPRADGSECRILLVRLFRCCSRRTERLTSECSV